MQFFNRPENWPVVAICIGMIAAAVIDWWKFKVPNKLTFPLIVAGWLLGLAINFGWVNAYLGEGGGFGPAFAGTFLGLALILPIYVIGGMGAGDCKMTMGFGSWVGAFFGYGSSAGPLKADWVMYSFQKSDRYGKSTPTDGMTLCTSASMTGKD